MLNLTGGIANVLYGKTQIQMEMAAGQYFKYSDFRKAENEYALSIGSYLQMLIVKLLKAKLMLSLDYSIF